MMSGVPFRKTEPPSHPGSWSGSILSGSGRSTPSKYLLAAVLVALALLFQLQVVKNLSGDPPDFLFILPITMAAYLGGRGPGIVASVLAMLADFYFIMAPRGSFLVSEAADRLEGALLLLTGILVTLLVAELQRARRSAEDSRAMYAVTLTSIGDSVITTGTDGRIRYLNPKAEAVTDWLTREVVGLPIDEAFPLIDGESGSAMPWPVNEAISKRESTSLGGRALLRRKDGSLIPIADSCAPIRDPADAVLGAVLVFRDATSEMEGAAAIEERRGLQMMLERLAATAPGVLYAFRRRPDGSVCFPYASPALASLFSINPEDLVQDGSAAFGNVHPDDLARVLATTELSAQEMAPWRQEFRLAGSGQREVWIEGHSVPTAEPDGGVVWYGFLNDITDRRRDEAALRENELRLAAIIGSAMDGIISIDEEQRIVLFNPAAEHMFGCSMSEAMGEPLSRFIPSRFHQSHHEHVEFFQRTGKTQRHTGVLGSVLGMRADGSEFPIEATISHITIGGNRQFTAILRDVEARTKSEAAIKQSEERFRQLASTIREVFWMTDANKRVMEYVSPGYERIWGRTCESLYASPRSWIEAIHPEDRERIMAAAGNQLNRPYDEEYRIIRPDGTTRWIRDRGFPVKDDAGVFVRIAGVAQDVTERRHLEEQVRQTQKMESVGLLAGGVAHDFNNFLTVIAGESELLLEQMAPNDPARAAVQEMHDAGERAAMLTRQLLAFSRQQVLEPRLVDLNQVVTDTERMLHRLLGEDVALESVLDPGCCTIRVDPGHLTQVLINLAVNARDAMPLGGKLVITTSTVELNDEAAAPLHAGRFVVLRLSDTGTGMSSEVQAHLFEPFFTTKGLGRGTGLGLSVVHGIIAQSGGKVTVNSELGRGTTFSIYLPCTLEVAVAVAEIKPAAVRRGGGERVLVVEDEEPVRRLAVRTLKAAGYQVREASDGLRAIELLNAIGQDAFDLLVTDLVMPNLSGRELAEEMLRRCPSVRVMYSSGYTDDAMVRMGIQAEAVAFLQKPYTPTELTRKVREVIDR